MSTIPITKRGAEKLKEELHRLKHVERPAVVQAIAEARAQGDLSENADYIAAKEEQAFLEGRIRTIEGMLRHVEIITEQVGGQVRIGSRITVTEVGTDDHEAFWLVGAAEANPMNGKISNESPLGKALLGKHIGDEVQIDAPAGQITFQIVGIE